MSYRREISPGVTSPTEIPAEADGPYLLEVLRNPRKKNLIQTPHYKVVLWTPRFIKVK